MKHSCWLLVVMLVSLLGCSSKVDKDTLRAACLERNMKCSVSHENWGDDWHWTAYAYRKNQAGNWDMWVEIDSTAEGAMGKLLPTLDEAPNFPGSDAHIEVTP